MVAISLRRVFLVTEDEDKLLALDEENVESDLLGRPRLFLDEDVLLAPDEENLGSDLRGRPRLLGWIGVSLGESPSSDAAFSAIVMEISLAQLGQNVVMYLRKNI